MTTYVLRRLALLVPTIFGISIMVFGLMRFLPGDVVDGMISPEVVMAQDQKESLRRLFGLDAPIHIQYIRWLSGVVQGDFGNSLRSSVPVTDLFWQRIGITAELALLAVVFSSLIAIPLGILSAVKRNGAWDYLTNMLGLVGLSFPNFWLATMLLLIVTLVFRWQPSLVWVSPFENLWGNLQQMLLPVISLSLALMAVVMRMTRSAMLEVLRQDFIRTARAKGQHETVVVTRHALKNAFIPVLTVIGLQIGGLLGGAVVIEQIFGLPGVGWMILNGIYQRDYPVVQGGVFFVALVFVVINLVVDLLYAYVDPRIRYS